MRGWSRARTDDAGRMRTHSQSPHPSTLIPHSSTLIPHSSTLIPHPSPLTHTLTCPSPSRFTLILHLHPGRARTVMRSMRSSNDMLHEIAARSKKKSAPRLAVVWNCGGSGRQVRSKARGKAVARVDRVRMNDAADSRHPWQGSPWRATLAATPAARGAWPEASCGSVTREAGGRRRPSERRGVDVAGLIPVART